MSREMYGRVMAMVVVVLAGCVMAPVQYWQPMDTHYRTLGGPCGAGPEDRVLIEYGDVAFQVSIRRETDRAALLIGIDIPAGHRLELQKNTLVVNGQTRSLGPARTRDSERATLVTVGSELVGSGEKKFRWVVSDITVLPRHFTIETPLPPARDHYRIQLPEVLLDGEPVALPELTFRKASGVFSTPINC